MSAQTSILGAPIKSSTSPTSDVSMLAALLLLGRNNSSGVCRQDVAMSILLYRSVAPMSIIGKNQDDPHCQFQRVRNMGSSDFGTYWLLQKNRAWANREGENRRGEEEEGDEFVGKFFDLSLVDLKGTVNCTTPCVETQSLVHCHHFAIVRHLQTSLVVTAPDSSVIPAPAPVATTDGGVVQGQTTVAGQSVVADNSNGAAQLLVIMEFMNGGDLDQQIKLRALVSPPNYFSEQEVAFVFIQLAMGLHHIHSGHMLHPRIQSSNVLLSDNGLVKFGDFGMDDSQLSEQHKFTGSPYHFAPEIWKRGRSTQRSDVWALGVLLFQLMALKRPFSGQDVEALMMATVSGTPTVDLPLRFRDTPLKAIVEVMLTVDPGKRPSMNEILARTDVQQIMSDFETRIASTTTLPEHVRSQILRDIEQARVATMGAASDVLSPVRSIGEINLSVSYEGPVKKNSSSGKKVWKNRYLVLTEGTLIISLGKGESLAKPLSLENVDKVLPIASGAVPATSVSGNARGRSTNFAIATQDEKCMFMQAPTVEERDEWLAKIQQALGVERRNGSRTVVK